MEQSIHGDDVSNALTIHSGVVAPVKKKEVIPSMRGNDEYALRTQM
jgi:hypothetical protein